MKVIHINDVEKVENASALFTAPVTLQHATTEKETDYNVAYVNFPEGVANKFHTHNHDQVLIVTEGKGFVASETVRFEMSVGDVALIKAGEVHKHGALPGSTMTHITITAPGTTITQLED